MGYDIASLKRKMLVKYPFFGSVVTNVSYKENKEIPTAGTDGKTIYYNPEFLGGLSVEEQTFVFAHEVCHIAFNHILRSDGKDPQLWNIATDAVINSFLKRDGLKMVEGGVDMAEAINYDAEQLYEKLLKEKGQQPQQNQNENDSQNQGQSQSGSGSSGQNSQSGQNQSGESNEENQENSQGQQKGSSSGENGKDDSKEQSSGGGDSSFEEQDSSKQDVGHDTHKMWEDAVKKQKEEQSQGKNKKESIFDKLFNKDSREQEKAKSEVEKKQEETEKMGEKEAFNKNADEKKKQLQELREAIAKEASTAGTSTNRDIRTVNDIGKSKPLIDWRYVLREAIQYDVDWSYKNAYVEDGVVNANLEEQPMPETEIVLDTSGSINEVLLKNFLRECKNILLESRVKVGCFDTEFYGFHDIRTEEDIETMKFKGGGGTNFDAAVGAFTKRVENKIIFTDGEASMPDMSIDAIWVVFGNERINPRGGKVIHIDEEALSRLCFDYDDYNHHNGMRR